MTNDALEDAIGEALEIYNSRPGLIRGRDAQR
jgi:hypothetical protein